MRLDCGQQDKKHFRSVNPTLPDPVLYHFFPEKTINRNESFTLVFPDNPPYFHPFTSTGKDPRKGWRTPLNNIKHSEQRDEETGYPYFGARYYDPEISGLFLSMDPMTDKYAGILPYAYCEWNPVKLVDPDGMKFDTTSIQFIEAFKKYTNDMLTKTSNKSVRKELSTSLDDYEIIKW